MPFTTAALTDLGLVRHENEDRFLNATDLGLFGVADGIGGLPKGAEAAECAVTTLTSRVRQYVADKQTIDLAEAVTATNRAVVALAEKITPSTGLGCTLCTGLVHSGTLQLVNVGDSRCYILRGTKLKLLTTDDTIEHEVEIRRARGEKIELDERYRNALTRCIGQPMDIDAKIFVHSLEKGDLLLFCSDGVSRMIEETAILKRLRDSKDVTAIARGLIDDALAAGGHDNATVVVVRIDSV